MPQLDRAVIKQRVSEVRALGESQLAAHLNRRVGTADMLLLEKGAKGYLSGYEKARLAEAATGAGASLTSGELIAVNIVSAEEGMLQVTPLNSGHQLSGR